MAKAKPPVIPESITPAKRGRPRLLPDLKVVERLAAQGLSQEQIAAAMGVSLRWLVYRKKDTKALADAIQRGHAKGISTVTNALFESAKGGNVTAQIFYLKNRAGWADRIEVENEFVLPAPLMIETIRDVTPTPQALGDKETE